MGAAAALASSALWAMSSVILTSQAGKLTPLAMSAIRTVCASLIVFGMLFATSGLAGWRDVTFVAALSMIASGVLAHAVGDTLYIEALGSLGVSRSFPITNSVYPFTTFLVAVWLLGEGATWFVPLGGALIIAGITTIVLERSGERREFAPGTELMRGLVLAVAAAIVWAVATSLLRGQQGGLSALGAASLRIPSGSIAVLGMVALTSAGAPPLRFASMRSLLLVAAAGVFGLGGGSVLFIYAVEHLGAAKTAFLTTSAPVFALPMGVVFLSERLTRRVAFGTALTVAGIWLVLL